MFEKQNLHQSLAVLGVIDPGDIFFELAESYEASTRHYHSDRHVSECLKHFSNYRDQAEKPAEIEIAIWFHDAIYDTTKSDNEEQSADWAKRYLTQKAVNPLAVDRIEKMIIATKTHQSESEDSALMVDIDLGILGASADVFEEYDAAIRREFHWVPTVQYCIGRSQVLSSFLKREAIYQTPAMFDLYEVQARENLSRKIKELALS
jgi:predicted metal-dependent HD superfamily phosphohydrolase